MKSSSKIRFGAAIVGSTFLLISSALAQKTGVEAEIKGPDGRAAKGAIVRIERQDKQAPGITTTTDANGRASAKNIDAGTYRIMASLASGARSEQVVKPAANRPVLVKFNMTPPAPGQAASAKKKIFVWVPTTTGTHMGGHYEEVGAAQMENGPNGQNIERVNPAAIQRPQYSIPMGSR
jgi:hypothetical protein